MKSRDLILLSSYLDGALDERERRVLESRLASDADLRAALAGLRETRSVLRRLPQRRAPRNFTLTRQMVGLRPPVPRAVPALRLASALAALFFFSSYLLGAMPMAASAPAPAEEPMLMQAAPEAMPAVGGAADMTATPEMAADNTAPTAGDSARAAPTLEPQAKVAVEPAPAPAPAIALNPTALVRWGLAGVAVVFALAAFFLRRRSIKRWK